MNLNLHLPGSWRIAFLALLIMLAAACGQKGDLYLPETQAITTASLLVH